ncbi:putative HTH transcriptional regulator [Bradyrhizobium sp. LM6.10]
MSEQGLSVSGPDNEQVTAGALILFGKRPKHFFSHAVVSVTEAGKKRAIYEAV